mgnify:CR=1 FL=1
MNYASFFEVPVQYEAKKKPAGEAGLLINILFCRDRQ